MGIAGALPVTFLLAGTLHDLLGAPTAADGQMVSADVPASVVNPQENKHLVVADKGSLHPS